MGLFSVSGKVTSVGQCTFDNDLIVYAFVEITEASDRRVIVEKVAVCNDVAARFGWGFEGELLFDLVFRTGRLFRCQLWGIKGDGVQVFDSRDMRKTWTYLQLMYGLLLTPLFGLGLLLLVPGLVRLAILRAGTVDRHRAFYGSDPGEARRLGQQQAVRL